MAMLWGRYHEFAEGENYALLDPVSMQSVFLCRAEAAELRSPTTPKRIVRQLEKLGLSPSAGKASLKGALLQRLRSNYGKGLPSRISGYRVVLTDKCNLSCSYCFVATNTGAPDMAEEDLAAGLEYLFEENKGQDEVSIQWFGGEPTIRFDLMKYGDELSVKLAKKFNVKRVRRAVVSNGMKLTDEMLCHYKRHSYGVGISFDGPPNLNSKFRTLLNGAPSDDRVLRNIKRLVEHGGIHVGLNITPTPVNYLEFPELITYAIRELGVKFIYANTPIPSQGHWTLEGQKLADSMFDARLRALQLGGMFFSVVDQIYQALDSRRLAIFDHLLEGNTSIIALLPGRKVSVCDINWRHPGFVFSLDKIRENKDCMSAIIKKPFPSAECETCPAAGVCAGPTANDTVLRGTSLPDPEYCAFFRRLLERAIWDDTGLQ